MMLPDADPEGLPPDLVSIATRATHEGVPVCATARILARPVEQVYHSLHVQLGLGAIVEMPKADWPATARIGDRLPSVPRTPSNDDVKFSCRKAFGLTALEAAFLLVLLTNERADKAKLHHVIEQQRLTRAQRPDKAEETDPKMVDVIVCKLRKKIKTVRQAPDALPFEITTVWGEGYYLTPAVKGAILAFIQEPADAKSQNAGAASPGDA